MRRYTLLAAVAIAAAIIPTTPAQADGQGIPNVAHTVSNWGANEINTLRVFAGAPVEIHAVAPPSWMTTSDVCRALGPNCIMAVNADLFDKAGWPIMGQLSDGVVQKAPGPATIAHQQLSFSPNGCLSVGPTWPTDALQSTGSSYTIVRAGQPLAITDPGQENMINHNHSRTMIGWTPKADGTCDLCFVTVSGPHAGVSMWDGARILQSCATEGVNMDGGSSTAMAIFGRLVSPPQLGREQIVHNMWVVMAKPGTLPAPPPPTPKPKPPASPPPTVAVTTPPVTVPTTLPAKPLQSAPILAISPLGNLNDSGASQPMAGQTLATVLLLMVSSLAYSRRKLLEQSLFRLLYRWRGCQP